MDAAERRAHERVQAELAARWAVWDRRTKWRIRAGIAWLAVALGVMAVAIYWMVSH